MKYSVIRSKRKSLCLTVGKNGDVLVRAPLFVGDREIEYFVMRHERWIVSRLEKRKRQRTLPVNDNDVLTLFGEPYRIGEGKPKISDGKIYLPASGREIALKELIKPLAKEKLTALAEELSSRYGFGYSAVRISEARTRWGSCNKKGVLSFTCFLSFVNPALARYVVVHELCHTRYFNHGKSFWREVEKVLPDWRARRAELRREEDCLEYLR